MMWNTLVDIRKFLSSVKCHGDCDILTLHAIDMCGESISVLLYIFSLIIVDGDVVHSLRDWGVEMRQCSVFQTINADKKNVSLTTYFSLHVAKRWDSKHCFKSTQDIKGKIGC